MKYAAANIGHCWQDWLRRLDRLVAAVQHHLHLNLCLTTLRGRTAAFHSDFSSEGDFDLFVNLHKQELANSIWSFLAERYQDIPNDYLSFTPFWEAMNYSLSTGLPAPEYTPREVGAYLCDMTEVIREKDSDRLIIYEPTPNNASDSVTEEAVPVRDAVSGYDNMLISYNCCEMPYVYANMTAGEGENVDNNNRGFFLLDYPVRYDSVCRCIADGQPITMEGCLPEGCVLDIFLRESGGGTFLVSVDGETLYEEALEKEAYRTDSLLSGYFPYAESEKKVQIVLEQDRERIELSFMGGTAELSGIKVTLPEAYAEERWYYASAYDVWKGLEEEEGLTPACDIGNHAESQR